MEKNEVLETSVRGQPIPPELLAELERQNFYREDQARDESGRWVDEGKGSQEPGYRAEGEATPKLSKEAREARESALGSVQERSQKLARAHGFAGRVDVVDQPPREFVVGTRHCSEAAHYNPSDGSIQINGRMVDDDSLPLVVAHECQHDKWHVVKQELERDHEIITKKIHEEPEWFDKTFRPSGEPKTEEARAELERDYPVSALFGKTIGDSYLELGGSFEKAKRDDGVSNYSKAYWSKEALDKNNSIDRAHDETLAEIARIKDQLGLREGDCQPSRRYRTLFIGINKQYERLK